MAVLLLRWWHCIARRRYIWIECEGLIHCTPALINVVFWLRSVSKEEVLITCRAKHTFARIFSNIIAAR